MDDQEGKRHQKPSSYLTHLNNRGPSTDGGLEEEVGESVG